MRVVLLLEAFLAGCVQVGAVDSNHIVAAVGGWVEDGFVFAHKGECDGGGNATEGARVGADVDEVPGAGIGKTCL